MIQKYYQKIKSHFKKTAKTPISDHRIAFSFAVGTFVALLPFSIFAIGIAFALLFCFKYLHKISVLFAIIFWNGFWNAVLLVPAIRIGHFILAGHTPFDGIPFVGQLLTGTQYYIVGISSIAVYAGFLSYFVLRLLVKLYRLRLERRKELLKRQNDAKRNYLN